MMVVITMTNCPNKIRGDLSKWMLEIDTGVFVGNLNPRIRDMVWDRICENIGNGRATMAFHANNEQNLDFRIHNAVWEPVDNDGIKLVLRKTAPDKVKMPMPKAVIYHNSRKTPVRSKPEAYVVLDIETTGINSDDKIIEIAALKISDNEISDRYQALININENLPKEIVELTGITDDMLTHGVSIDNALRDLTAFVGNMTIVGHNIIFDMDFIQRAYSESNIPLLSNLTVDTKRLSRKKLKALSSFSLKSVAEFLGIPPAGMHRAINDCLITYEVYEKLKQI